jgi:hypothetical protein
MSEQSAEVVEFKSGDGLISLRVAVDRDDLWLTQSQIGELYTTTQQNAALHLSNALKDGEITQDSTHKESLYVAGDGKRRTVTLYNLDAIISVGYRVKSRRGTEFRIWATRVLRERLIGRSTPADYANLSDRLGRLEQLIEQAMTIPANTNATPGAIISDSQYDALTMAIKRQALLEVLAGDWPDKPMRQRRAGQALSLTGARRRVRTPVERASAGIRNHLAEVLRWGTKGKPWRMLPVSQLSDALAVLRAREVDVIRKLGGLRAARHALAEHDGQLGLFETGTKKRDEDN